LASASATGTVKLWDTKTWQMRPLPGQRPAAVRALAFSPDGKKLTLGCAAHPIKGTRYYTLLGKRDNVQWMGPRPDDLPQWDLASGHELPLLPHQPYLGVISLAAGPGVDSLLAGSQDGAVWHWKQSLPSSPPRLYVSPKAQEHGEFVDRARNLGFAGLPDH